MQATPESALADHRGGVHASACSGNIGYGSMTLVQVTLLFHSILSCPLIALNCLPLSHSHLSCPWITLN